MAERYAHAQAGHRLRGVQGLSRAKLGNEIDDESATEVAGVAPTVERSRETAQNQVSPAVPSWNQLREWLQQMDVLRGHVAA